MDGHVMTLKEQNVVLELLEVLVLIITVWEDDRTTDPPPAEWKTLLKAIHVAERTYDEGVVNQSIMWAMDGGVAAQVAGTYRLSDPANPGSGGVYTVGSNIENSCSKETIPISGTYKCGADVKTSSANNRIGSTIKMTCPGEKPCYVHLLLSDEGELMMVSGEYSGASPSDRRTCSGRLIK